KEYQDLLEKLETLSEQLDHREFVVAKKEREIASKAEDLEQDRLKLERKAQENHKRLEESLQEFSKASKIRVHDAEQNVIAANKERDVYRQKFLELEMKKGEKDVI